MAHQIAFTVGQHLSIRQTHPQNVLTKLEKTDMTPEMIKAFMEPLAGAAIVGIFAWVMVTMVRMP
jgi:Na+/proline symporter